MTAFISQFVSPEVFLVPVNGFFADPDNGVGWVHMPDAFHEVDPPARLKIIAEWQRALAGLQTAAFMELYQRTLDSTHGQPPAVRRQAFDRACKAVGQSWPPEVGELIQRDLGPGR